MMGAARSVAIRQSRQVAGSGTEGDPNASTPTVNPFQSSPLVVVKVKDVNVPTNSITPLPSVPANELPLTDRHVLHPPQYADP
jgi:hypothetical protein